MDTLGNPAPARTQASSANALSSAVRYALAIGGLVVALLLRWGLDPLLGDALPFVTLFGAVAFAVWIGGIRPAVVVVVLGYVAVNYYLFISPRGDLVLSDLNLLTGFLAYLFTSALIIGLGETARLTTIRARGQGELLRVTLHSIGDAVITTDTAGRVTHLNTVAEALTGWTRDEARGLPLETVFRIVNEDTRGAAGNPAVKALREGVVVGLANHTVLLHRSGGEHPIDDSAAPIRDESGQVSGCVLIFRDVTAQRHMERERAGQLLTARLLASIVESSDDAIVSKSLDGIIQSWNESAARLFGHTAEQAIGRHISLVIPPDRIQEEEHIIARLKAGERIDHFETERVRADGTRILVSLTISPIKDETGTVVGASKIVRDITLQRQAEQRERRLLADAIAATIKFQAFFEQSALVAAILDVNGSIREANRGLWEGCGYERDDVVGKPIWEALLWARAPDDAARLKTASADAAAGRSIREEMRFHTGAGEERMAVVAVQPIMDDSGRVLQLAFIGIDITDRKRAEAEREKFVTLVENSTDFIGLCDLRGVPFFVNRAGLEMVGLESLEEARNTPVASFFFPEDQQRIMEEFFPSVLAEGHGEVEVRFRHFKTGEARWMAYKVLTLPDANGLPMAFATVSQDVTAHRKMEDSLRTLAADLSEADHRKNEFLAMLAHELRNPLAPISNAARALRMGRRDNETVRSASDMLERQVGQLARLVDDLLDVSRITRGTIELRKARVELAPIVQQAVEAARPLCRSLKHDLTVMLPDAPIFLEADAARLTQVIGNLLNNACKFTDQGGRIALSVERDGAEAIIRVHDNGIGIARDHLHRVFDMFAQVDTSLERSRDGLGLGLTLVKTLVELHNGTVGVLSDGPGRGSEFTIRLPVVSDSAASASKAADVGTTPVVRRRVLIVDDNHDGAESLSMLLEFAGHETQVAHDGLEAIGAAERYRPDVVLLDIGLPTLNGYEVCRRLRQEPWGRDLAIVALTGWGQDEDRHRSREAGFSAHLVKPVDHEVLAKLIASLFASGSTSASRSGGDIP